jgi:hypothetical protein
MLRAEESILDNLRDIGPKIKPRSKRGDSSFSFQKQKSSAWNINMKASNYLAKSLAKTV